ncbi:MAG TPA: YlbF family regulator [Anaerolineales bacterium]|nr:YlbF family regulator [Anaerolineales bacterium]
MNTDNVALSPQLLTATEALAVNLRQSEPFVLYHQARDLLEADAQAQALLRQLSEAQADVRARSGQARGEVTQHDVDQLRALQRMAQANRVIMDYVRTQQFAIDYWREVNRDVSELLGVDFASLARRPGCC